MVIVGLGKSDQGLEESLREGHDLQREAVRKGVSNAVRSLKNSGGKTKIIHKIAIEILMVFQELKRFLSMDAAIQRLLPREQSFLCGPTII